MLKVLRLLFCRISILAEDSLLINPRWESPEKVENGLAELGDISLSVFLGILLVAHANFCLVLICI